MTWRALALVVRSLRCVMLGLALHIASAAHAWTRDAAVGQAAAVTAQDRGAIGQVTALREVALAIAGREGAIGDGAISSLGRDLRAKFDVVAITRSVLGSSWDQATSDARYDAVQTISDLLAQAAVTQFAKYRNLPFAVRDVLHVRNGDVVVVSEFVRSDGKPVRIDWRLSVKGETMRFVDIALDAKSMVVKYRQEATDIIRANNNSVRAFIVNLRERLPTTPY
jgi:ABC-type transporter MlaC component